MIKRYTVYTTFLLFYLIGHSLFAQQHNTATSIGFIGGQKTVIQNGKKVIYGISSGHVVATPHQELIKDEVSFMSGFRYDARYFPVVFDKDLFVSKGYFSDYVQLKWNVVALESRIKKFRIFRKPLGQHGDSLLVAVVAADESTWRDAYVEKGVLYKYTVFAEGLADKLRIPFINVVESTGFALSTGTVTGRITYDGGTAVEGVNVMAETNGNLKGKSIYLNGQDAYLSLHHGTSDHELELSKGFSFQLWCRFEGDSKGTILSKGNQYEMAYEPGTTTEPGNLSFRVKDAVVSLPFKNPVDTFFHVTGVYETSGKVKLYVHVSASRVDSAIVTGVAKPDLNIDNIKIGIGQNGHYFKGYIDEMRLWQKSLSFKEVQQNFNRYINGDEAGLAGYWRFNDGVGNQFYDLARKGFEFFENHGLIRRAIWSDITPLQSQLTFRGVTNKDGNYTITGFPYETGGSLYTFTPMLGVHTFEPKQHLRFVGNGASIHNGLDFKDNSSFKVSGTVRYQNSKFPVEGVSILIDGKSAVNKEGALILSDKLGQFMVDVPIGEHSIRLVKSQHGFKNEGRFPGNNAKGEVTTFNFLSPLSGLEFIDTTLVKVVGRIVGGPIEAEKPLGFKKSKNNIGNATLYLTSEKGYDLTLKDSVATYNERFVNSTAEFSTKNVKVIADPESGEYVAYLPPEKYKVTAISAGDYNFGEQFKVTVNLLQVLEQKEEYIDTLKVEVKKVHLPGYPPLNPASYDTIYTTSKADTLITLGKNSFSYHTKQNFIYRTIPSIEVTNLDKTTLFGDKYFIYKNDNLNRTDTISLIKEEKYNFGHPIFTQQKSYSVRIKLFEAYTNKDNNTTSVVPVKDGKIGIVNNLAIQKESELGVDQAGQAIYTFTAGLPNLSQDITNSNNNYTQTLNITAYSGNNGQIATIWREENPMRGIIFGGYPVGNNFVTNGPDRVIAILRDPPGTSSYATLSKGSTFSSTSSWNVKQGTESENSISIRTGIESNTIIGGLISGVINKTEAKEDITFGINHNQEFEANGSTSHTSTFTQSYSTSDSPDFIGAEGDVFIGNATNIVYGKCLNLTLVPSSDCITCSGTTEAGFQIGTQEALRLEPKFGTSFVYSQFHIENVLIPGLESLRNNLLMYTENPASVTPVNKPVYMSLIPKTDSRFGSNNSDVSVWMKEAKIASDQIGQGPSYVIKVPANYNQHTVDSVLYYNEQIKGWRHWLAENEKQKLEAAPDKNYSLDGGVSIEESIETVQSSSASRAWNMQLAFANDFETVKGVNLFGARIVLDIKSSYKVSVGGGTSAEDSQEHTNTYGFVLADGDKGDAYSIDVKKPADGFGPVFVTRGGQTSCPNEGKVVTKYYKPGEGILSFPTVAREKVAIQVDKAVVADVPENRAAEFVLKLRNESPTNEDQFYDLVVDESTNPHGAVLEVDGLPIGNGRSFMVPAGKTLQKILKIRKGTSAVMEYKDISFVLQSRCDGNIADTVAVTAYFLPGCSDIAISAPKNQWVLNTNTQPTEVLNVEISKFDLNFANFKRVLFQYKPSGSSQWTTDMVFYNPAQVTPEEFEKAEQPKAWIQGAKINYPWNMNSLPDRNYDIRAKAICELGPGYEVETPTEILSGIKDVKRPKLFGSPQPADGILSAGDEIAIQFDEPIQAGLLTPFNFSVQGVLNNYPLNHNTSINLDGINDYVKIADGLSLSGSFTVEFWLKRNAINKESVLFSQGNTINDALEIGFTSNNKLFVDIAGQRIQSTVTLNDMDWHHYAISYNATTKKISAFKDDTFVLEGVPVGSTGHPGNGPIAIGKSVVTHTNFIEGNIYELRVWSKALQIGQVYSQMNTALSGSEMGLVGYWPMNEAFGNKAFDKARFRHALLFADWQVTPKGNAYAFDGVDDHVKINTASTVIITDEMDYTVEFWFKGEPGQANAVMFSSGKGDGTDQFNAPNFSLSIGFNESSNLFMRSNGQEIILGGSENNYLDNNWHHLAIAVSRKGNTNIYVDGTIRTSKSSDGLGGIAGDQMWLGARGYKSSSVDVQVDQHFKGAMDEFRIWKLARREQQLNLDRMAKLKGDEKGLVAYYPFEYYATVSGIKMLEPTLKDQWKNPYGANGGIATVIGGAEFSKDAPNIKDARPVTKIDFDWAVNGDKIIITPAARMASVIEKTIIEITVSDVEDLYENRIASPVSWTAFADKNQLKWGNDALAIEKKLYEPYTFTVDLINRGGKEQKFSIKNLPPWLSAQTASGTLAPLTSRKMIFTVNEALNTGYYNEDIFLSGDFGFDEKLQISLSVMAEAPQWKVNPSDFQYSMNIIGQVKIDGIISSDVNDKVAAFVNGECRGVANLKYIEQYDMYQAYLDIYSNKVSEEKIELRVWDASQGTEHRDVKPEYTFIANDLHGTPSKPDMITVGTAFVQNLNLEKGWNWISLNIISDSLARVNTTMKGLNSKNGDQIKGQRVVDVFAEGLGWSGSLSSSGGFKVGNMYMVRSSNAGKLELAGNQINPALGIAIQNGWNWIGVVPRFNMLVNEALANLSPANGDVIKGKRAFATYQQGLGWIGSLQYVVPGEGYLLKSSSDATLVFPKTSSLKGARITTIKEEKVKGWTVNSAAFPDNMTVIAQIENVPNEDFVIGAFAGSECRGFASPIQVESQTMYFLTIHGLSSQNLNLKAYRISDGSIYELAQKIQFSSNSSKGTVPQPLNLSMNKAAVFTAERIEAYPNPFTEMVTLEMENAQSTYVVKVTDLVGREIKQFRLENADGKVNMKWDGTNKQGTKVSSGTYLIHISSDSYSKVIKVIKK